MALDCYAHVAVYQVLDGLLAGKAIPPGAKGTMFAITDSLRAEAGNSANVRRAERICLEIRKLEIALHSSDQPSELTSRQELKLLATDWLNARSSGSCKS